jgi:predicted DCC family thiol-disulfide oxidoreductase YuxK
MEAVTMSLKIFYDGECTFCANYVKLLKLREQAGQVELISLRDTNDDVSRVLQKGYNVNTGFVVEHDGITYHGKAAFAYLNSLAGSGNWLNRTIGWFGQQQKISRIIYPFLVVLRYLLLALQGGALIRSKDARDASAIAAETYGSRAIRLHLLLLVAIYVVISIESVSDFGWQAFYVTGTVIFLAGYVYSFSHQDHAIRLAEKLRNGSLLVLLAYLALWFVLTNTGNMIVMRRVLAFVAGFPAIGLMLDLYLARRHDSGSGHLVAGTPFALLLFCLIPGFIFPPFYGGIAGWTVSVDKSMPVAITGVRLVNDQNEEIWHNPAFLQPHTQKGRFRKAFLHSKRTHADYMAFLLKNYRRIYPILEKGRLPHQVYIGAFAYPTHNLQRNNSADYVDVFHPDRIVALKYQTRNYNWDRSLHSVKDGFVHTVPAK